MDASLILGEHPKVVGKAKQKVGGEEKESIVLAEAKMGKPRYVLLPLFFSW